MHEGVRQAEICSGKVWIERECVPKIRLRLFIFIAEKEGVAEAVVCIGAAGIELEGAFPMLHRGRAVALLVVNQSQEVDGVVIVGKESGEFPGGLELFATERPI